MFELEVQTLMINMTTLTYKPLKEKIVTSEELKFIKLGENKGYVFISRDGSEIIYRASGKSYGFKKEKEKVRAYFLVKLIEEYKYSEKSIQLDVEVPGVDSADLVVYEKILPYIIVECQRAAISQSEIKKAQKQVIEKAKVLKAKYAVLVVGPRQMVFDIQAEAKQILNLPSNYKEIKI